MADPDDSLMLSILKEVRADLKETHGDLRKHQDLLLSFIEATRRRFDAVDRRFDAIDRRFETVDRRFDAIEHRISDTTGEFELMLKGEMLGRMTQFETQLDRKLAELSDRIGAKGPQK